MKAARHTTTPRSRWAHGLAAVAGVLVAGACGPRTTPAGSLTVGVQTDDLSGLVGSLHATTTVDAVPQADEVFRASDGPLFPKEIAVDGKGDASAKVSVRIEAFAGLDPSSGEPPLLVRTARTEMVPGIDKLLRIRLESRCVNQWPPGSNNVPGPTCTAPQTCVGGACVDDTVPGPALENYVANWPTAVPDICRPANPGPPEVVVGTGQTDFLPLTDGQVVQAELGPQGGHHFYVAVRMRNLKRSGSTTTISATQPGTGLTIPPTSFVFTFDPDEGGYCKLYGLRYQLDNQGIDYHPFLGQPLDVKVEVRDSTGAVGDGMAHVNIDPTILGG